MLFTPHLPFNAYHLIPENLNVFSKYHNFPVVISINSNTIGNIRRRNHNSIFCFTTAFLLTYNWILMSYIFLFCLWFFAFIFPLEVIPDNPLAVIPPTAVFSNLRLVCMEFCAISQWTECLNPWFDPQSTFLSFVYPLSLNEVVKRVETVTINFAVESYLQRAFAAVRQNVAIGFQLPQWQTSRCFVEDASTVGFWKFWILNHYKLLNFFDVFTPPSRASWSVPLVSIFFIISNSSRVYYSSFGCWF